MIPRFSYRGLLAGFTAFALLGQTVLATGETVTGGISAGGSIGTNGTSYSVTSSPYTVVTTRLPTPITPTATALNTSQIQLTWTPAATDALFTNYTIYRATTSGVSTSSTLVATITDQTTSSYTNSDLTQGTTYYYKMYVTNTLGTDSGSEVSATTTTSLTTSGAGGSGSGSSSGGGGGGGGSSSTSNGVVSPSSSTSTTSTSTTPSVTPTASSAPTTTISTATTSTDATTGASVSIPADTTVTGSTKAPSVAPASTAQVSEVTASLTTNTLLVEGAPAVQVGEKGETYSKPLTVNVTVSESTLKTVTDPRLLEVVAVNKDGLALDIADGKDVKDGKTTVAVDESATVVTRVVDALPISADAKEAVTTSKPVLLPADSNTLPVAVTMTSGTATANIAASTQVTDSNGQPYTGIIHEPSVVKNPPKSEGIVGDAIFIGTAGTSLNFSSPVELSLTVPEGTSADAKVYYFDTAAKDWKIAGDGGKIVDGKLVVSVTHFTLYAAKAPVAMVSSSGFSDTENHWAKDYINTLVSKGVFKQGAEFRPDAPIIRAELVKVLVEAFKLPASTESVSFTDIDQSAWYTPYLQSAVKAGVIAGNTVTVDEITLREIDVKKIKEEEEIKNLQRILSALKYDVPVTGALDKATSKALWAYQLKNKFGTVTGAPGEYTVSLLNKESVVTAKTVIQAGKKELVFRPNDQVTRAEAVKMILAASGVIAPSSTATLSFEDVPADQWFTPFVAYAFEKGIVKGRTGTTFAPSDAISRAEIAKIVSTMLSK